LGYRIDRQLPKSNQAENRPASSKEISANTSERRFSKSKRESGTGNKPPTRAYQRRSGRRHKKGKPPSVNFHVAHPTSSSGYQQYWRGYKLHWDVADGQIPISMVLTGAAVHDSQVAIPLATITSQRVTSLYDLMDSAYDAPSILEHSRELGHSRSSIRPIAAGEPRM
jgi:hypothetical protein